jgi:hypothetical protein
MKEDASHLTAHGVAHALAQILDLLGQVLAVEAVILSAKCAQDIGLILQA